MPSLIHKLHQVPLAFVDVETTGASAELGDRVIEIGIVRIENGRRVAEYQQLIDPRRRIGPGIVALTGISNDMTNGQPLFADVLPRIVELLCGAVIVGHNVRFDLSFLASEFRRCGQLLDACLSPLAALSSRTHVLDTVRIARRRFGRGGNGLQRLAARLGIDSVTAHRALADALTTSLVFERLMEPVGGWNLCLCDAINQQGGAMSLSPQSQRESILPLELTEALELRLPVMMEYVDARSHRTQREIEPLEIRRFKGELVLIAHCRMRNERRNFKIDRIVRLMRLEPQASVRNELFPAGG